MDDKLKNKIFETANQPHPYSHPSTSKKDKTEIYIM
jgi:hypothetical protein